MKDNADIVLANGNYGVDWFSQGLTEYAAGLPVGKCEKLLNYIAPEVKVAKSFEYYKSGEKSALIDTIHLDDVMRSTHGEFAFVGQGHKLVNAKCHCYGLTTRVEDDDEFIVKQAVEELKSLLIIKDLSRALAMLDKIVKPIDIVWKKGNDNNPIKDLRNLLKEASNKDLGNANRLLFGADAWACRAEFFGADSPNYTMSPDALALTLGIDSCVVSTDRGLIKRADADGKITQSQDYIVRPERVYAFASSGIANTKDASVLKRFVAKPYTVYTHEVPDALEITVSTYSLLAQTGVGDLKCYSVKDN